MDLTQWGWSPELETHFQGLDDRHLSPGRVARQDRTGYLVVHPAGETFARIPGHLRDDPPAVGDWVALDGREPPTIRALLPRRSKIARRAAGREEREQVIAANLDLLFIVVDASNVNRASIERYQVLAAGAGIRAVVIANKSDLTDTPTSQTRPGLATSASTGAGLEELRALIPPGTTAAFVGPSGVGKSSLVNALLGEGLLETGPVRSSDRKGRHTTTARHLVALAGGGIVLDTPGMRELGLWNAEGEGVSSVFADVAELASRCRFRDCAHESEPGCAVRESVSPERLASWRKLQREAASAARRADVAASRREARAWGKMAKRTLEGKRERLRD